MRQPMRVFSGFVITVFVLTVSALAQGAPAGEQKSIVIVFSDGHRRNIPLNEIDRIEFKSGPVLVFRDGNQQNLGTTDIARIEFSSQIKDLPFGRNHFVGKWEVGVGAFGAGHFFITLDSNGEAHKTLGSSHGKWTLVDGEARINWDDGWHDAIRKIGSKYEKRAYAPEKTFSDQPSNVTDAKNMTAEPI
jgi:hypothetical protein